MKKIFFVSFTKNHYTFINQVFDNIIGDFLTEYSFEYVLKEDFIRTSKFGILYKKFDLFIVDEPYLIRDLITLYLGLYLNPTLNKRFILCLHNINKWTKPAKPQKIKGHIKILLRTLIIKKINEFIVVGSETKKYLKSIYTNRTVYFIPFYSAECVKIKDESNESNIKLSIVIPGMVSKRRNYSRILSVFQEYDINSKYNLILLGRPDDEYGHEIVMRCHQNHFIKTFSEFIIPEEFENYMINSCLIFSDFDVNFDADGTNEIYGTSKESGIIFQALIYGKLLVVPSEFKVPSYMKNQCLFYKDVFELKQLLQNLNQDVFSSMIEVSKENLNSMIKSIDKIYV